jgi:2'-5' RNA ligase
VPSGTATERLFYALRPDAAAATRIHALTLQLCGAHGLKARPPAIERLHLTLCFLGDHAGMSAQQFAAADAAGRMLRPGCFEIVFDHVECFGHQGVVPLVLIPQEGSPPLRELHDDLTARVAPTGLFDLDARPFRPHVTLLYAEKRIPAQRVTPVSWEVEEVLLIRSHIGRGQHEVLGRYPLR